MPTLHSLRSRVKTLSSKNPSSDPADVARIFAMLAPMAGVLGCGDPGPEDEKKGGDSGENTG